MRHSLGRVSACARRRGFRGRTGGANHRFLPAPGPVRQDETSPLSRVFKSQTHGQQTHEQNTPPSSPGLRAHTLRGHLQHPLSELDGTPCREGQLVGSRAFPAPCGRQCSQVRRTVTLSTGPPRRPPPAPMAQALPPATAPPPPARPFASGGCSFSEQTCPPPALRSPRFPKPLPRSRSPQQPLTFKFRAGLP